MGASPKLPALAKSLLRRQRGPTSNVGEERFGRTTRSVAAARKGVVPRFIWAKARRGLVRFGGGAHPGGDSNR
jgi:hypothetical protein